MFNLFWFTFVGKCQLVAQVKEAVVYRCGGEHQHLGANACTDHLVEQLQVTVLLLLFIAVDLSAVAEVVALIDHHQVVIAPVDPVERQPVGVAVVAGQVGVIQHIVPQAILGNGVVGEVAAEGDPVVAQFLGTEYQHRLVPVLVVLYHRQGGKCFAKPHTVGQDTAIELLQLVDDGQGGILLKIIEFVPNLTRFESGGLVGQHILRKIFQKLIKYIVEGDEIDILRGILPINI